MQLRTIKYKTIDGFGHSGNWSLEELNLRASNLIVGRNAVGKSRVAQLVVSFAKMISQQSLYLYRGIWNLSFENSKGQRLKYELKVIRANKIEERISLDGKELLIREKKAKIFSFKTKNDILISPPENKLTLHVRRDLEEFPFFEEIVNWAEQTYGFKFGNISPYSFLINKKTDRLTSIDNIPKLLEELNEVNQDKRPDYFLYKIMDDFNSLGYEIRDIKTESDSDKSVLTVKEGNLKSYLRQDALSQGMFRSLALLIFMEYMISIKKVSTIIIDDLCEGLDYDRASKLGRLIFTKSEENNIQLIATTNDSFLMDSVDIKNWNILLREDNVVKALNYENNPKLFEEFKYTGLSNFDLFSSDYLLDK